MFTITKDFHFSASHQLTGLPDDHQCARLHGHNYVVRVGVEAASLQEPGFVIDFGELGFVKRFLDDEWDHRHLNDVLPYNPTAERMAQDLAERVTAHIADLMPHMFKVSVGVQETAKCWAVYTEGVWR